MMKAECLVRHLKSIPRYFNDSTYSHTEEMLYLLCILKIFLHTLRSTSAIFHPFYKQGN